LKEFLQERDTITYVSCNISSSSEDDETVQGIQVNIENIPVNKEKHQEIWKRTKNHQEQYRETEAASSTIMKYLLEKKEKETKTENVVHPVDAFLSGIGATLKTLDPYNLNLMKSRIFNIVQEIEIKQILYKQTDTFYNNAPTSSSAGNPYIGTHNLYNRQSTSFSRNFYTQNIHYLPKCKVRFHYKHLHQQQTCKINMKMNIFYLI